MIKVIDFLEDFASRHNTSLKEDHGLTAKELLAATTCNLSELFVNDDLKTGLDLYYEIHTIEVNFLYVSLQ